MGTEVEMSGDALLDQAASQIQQALAEEGVETPVEEPEDDVVLDEEPEEADEVVDEEPEEDAGDDPYADLDDDQRAEMDKAYKAGWRPKEEFKGNPKYWKDFDEFNKVGDRITSNLMSKIDNLSDQVSRKDAMIQKLIKAQGAIVKQAQAEAMTKLQTQRKEAIKYGDVDAVEALDAEIEHAKTKAKETEIEAEEEAPAPQIDDAVKDFIEAEKSWFNNANPDMVQYAITIEGIERKTSPGDASEDIMARVKAAVEQRFPHRMATTKPQPKKREQVRPAAVEGGTRSIRGTGPTKLSEFPPEVQRMADFFEKECGISKKEYLKSLREGMN